MEKISLFEQVVMRTCSFLYTPFKRFEDTKKITYKEFIYGRVITTSIWGGFFSLLFPSLIIPNLLFDFSLFVAAILFLRSSSEYELNQIMLYEKDNLTLEMQQKKQTELKNELLITNILNRDNNYIEKEKEFNNDK